jgi:hypothetical protein
LKAGLTLQNVEPAFFAPIIHPKTHAKTELQLWNRAGEGLKFTSCGIDISANSIEYRGELGEPSGPRKLRGARLRVSHSDCERPIEPAPGNAGGGNAANHFSSLLFSGAL